MRNWADLNKTARCPQCGGLLKPDIVFFGETLPECFLSYETDLYNAGRLNDIISSLISDLVLIIGTSLSVKPFNTILDYTQKSTPKVVLNNEWIGHFDICILGNCDDSISNVCEVLKWRKALRKLDKAIIGHRIDETQEVSAFSETERGNYVPVITTPVSSPNRNRGKHNSGDITNNEIHHGGTGRKPHRTSAKLINRNLREKSKNGRVIHDCIEVKRV